MNKATNIVTGATGIDDNATPQVAQNIRPLIAHYDMMYVVRAVHIIGNN